jgi:hypothetical protein
MNEEQAQQAQLAADQARKRLVEAAEAKKNATQLIKDNLTKLADSTVPGHVWDVNDARYLETIIKEFTVIFDATDVFSAQLAHDQYQLSAGLNELNRGIFLASAMVESLAELLKQKSVVTNEELEATWQRVVNSVTGTQQTTDQSQEPVAHHPV